MSLVKSKQRVADHGEVFTTAVVLNYGKSDFERQHDALLAYNILAPKPSGSMP